jgi:SAM-dependent methyltransferase
LKKSLSQNSYRKHYLDINLCYPSVFALKFFLGRNPGLNLTNINKSGKKLLDVGFGDGRDLKLFLDLGFDTYGVEVDDRVVAHTLDKFSENTENPVKLSVGFNDNTGFSSNTFDFVYSSAALMYLRDETVTLGTILEHINDILRGGGWFLGTFTKSDSHITEGAIKLDANRLCLKDDFYKQREGQIYHVHHSEQEVICDLESVGFSDVRVCQYQVDWFGTIETAFMFSARKS